MSTFEPTSELENKFHAHLHHQDGHHHVSSMPTLLVVLSLLLGLTVLTFAAYFFEQWLSTSFGLVIPSWVNVAIAMSIAVVKGTMVMMYFMHLRTDNPLNTIIMLFCFFAFALFLGLTAIDLDSRDSIYAWKKGQIIPGGTLLGPTNNVINTEDAKAAGKERVLPFSQGQSIVDWAHANALEREGPEGFAALEHDVHPHAEVYSDANISRPRAGLTPGLFGAQASSHNNATHADPAHAEQTDDHAPADESSH